MSGGNVSATVRNVGTTPAGPFRVSFFLVRRVADVIRLPGDGILVGSKDVPSLGAGASVGASMAVSVPANFDAGLYALSAVADVENAIPEAAGQDGAVANGRVATRAINVVAPPTP